MTSMDTVESAIWDFIVISWISGADKAKMIIFDETAHYFSLSDEFNVIPDKLIQNDSKQSL